LVAVSVNHVQDWQSESGRLTGSRLGLTDNVLTSQSQRNRLFLDWRGLYIAMLLNGRQ